MWMSKTITTRIMICLAALTVPLQGFSAASCHCGPRCSQSITNCCSDQEQTRLGETPSCCCTDAPVCHCGDNAEITKDSASSSESQSAEPGTCSCGADCHCSAQSQPVSPLIPSPVEKNPAEKLVSLSQLTVVSTVIAQPQTPGIPGCITAPQASLDRCVSLCRFTL